MVEGDGTTSREDDGPPKQQELDLEEQVKKVLGHDLEVLIEKVSSFSRLLTKPPSLPVILSKGLFLPMVFTCA